ncbi:glycosyltransferase family 39 protein [Mycobacterium sp. NPDC050551]|uniref:glycosyltransferase family 39 protein n=1 Tax=Mycobacterium sp. NPDC050551 TaxID=3155407 RepID=UPI00342A9F9E
MPSRDPRTPRAAAHRIAHAVLLLGTAALYLWNLSASGWANAFYSAAAQAGGSDATAMLFGSSDAANAITVDKTPAALWVMDLSVRLFGLHPWSVLAPQAIEGVAAVALLYAAVRRVSGPGAALIAGTVLALTPVAALIFRFNNPDALLVLLLVAAAYCVQRACEPESSRWWLIAAGVAVGFGFLAKMLQALLVLPGFAAAYLYTRHRSLGRRTADLLGAGVAMVIAAGWYLLLVELWPASERPYIGGSQHNSIVELALGYNGFGRLTGAETGGLGNLNHDVGWGRLFGAGMGADIAWLLPAAIVCLVAAALLSRRRDVRAALLLWGGWLVVTAVVFSFMHGIVHSYYTVALAPAIGAAIGIGSILLWRNRSDPRVAAVMSATVLVTAVVAAVLLGRQDTFLPWLRTVVMGAGVVAAVLLLVNRRLPERIARAAAAIAVAVCLTAPAVWSIATAATPHRGAIPTVGPDRGFAGPGGRGHGFAGPVGPGHGFTGPVGLLSAPTPGPGLTAALSADAQHYTWAAAVAGSNNAAGYQLATGAPVMAVGGFNGTDPAPTVAEFQQLVAEHRIHYFVEGRLMPGAKAGGDGGSRDAALIAEWVAAHFRPTVLDGVVVYDLDAPAPDS